MAGSGGSHYHSPHVTGLGHFFYFYPDRELSRRQDRNRWCVSVTLSEPAGVFCVRIALWHDLAFLTDKSPGSVTANHEAWKKVAIGVGIAVLLAIIVGFTVLQSSKNVVTVQTGKVQRQDLATVVSASGEIKPKTYVNIGANAYGKITHLYVKEGEQVKRGQLLAQMENVQSAADVTANQAAVQAAETDALAADAALEDVASRPGSGASRLRPQQARLGSRPESV